MRPHLVSDAPATNRACRFLSPLAAIAIVIASGCSSESVIVPSGANGTSLEALTSTTLSGIVGEVIGSRPAVRLNDHRGQPVGGVRVAFVVTGGGSVTNTSSLTNPDGVATAGDWILGTQVGSQAVTALVMSSDSVVFTAAATAGPVASIVVIGGDQQSAPAGETLPLALVVRLTDAYGNAAADVAVSFAVVSGAGSIDAGTATTNGNGWATSGMWQLGSAAGAQHVRAFAPDVEATFTAYALEVQPCPNLPHCERIAFVTARDGNAEIYSVNPDGTGLARLTRHAAVDDQPAWSPDGQRIAFVSDRSGSNEIYVMNADGSQVVRRTFSASYSQNPTWSPDGTRIAYSTLSDGSANLWLVSPDSTGAAATLLFSAPGWDDHPAWSPDGTRVALVSDWFAYDMVQDIFVIKADGSGFTAVTGNIFDHVDYQRPSWSPDGTRIAVAITLRLGIDEYTTRIGVMNASGSGLTPLIAAATWSRSSWSPDGQVIAFTSGTTGAPNVSWVKADGSSSGIIVSNGWNPDWRR